MVDSSQTGTRLTRVERDRGVNRVLWIVLGLNFLVAGLKLGFGFLAGSLSMMADGVHSTLDGSGNVVGLVGMKLARKAPDERHPYGHRKFEALAALAISIFLFITCYEIVTSVFGRFHDRHRMEVGILTFAVMIFTMGVNFVVTRYERRQGRRLRSMILLADSRHTQSDIFASIGVIISLVAALLRAPAVDLAVALGIAAFIAWSGYTIVNEAFSVLADAQMVDPDEVVRVATTVPGVTRAHRVRSRGLPDDIHVDLHLHVSPQMTIADGHELAHRVTQRIKDEFGGVSDVVVHVEPEDEHGDEAS